MKEMKISFIVLMQILFSTQACNSPTATIYEVATQLAYDKQSMEALATSYKFEREATSIPSLTPTDHPTPIPTQSPTLVVTVTPVPSSTPTPLLVPVTYHVNGCMTVESDIAHWTQCITSVTIRTDRSMQFDFENTVIWVAEGYIGVVLASDTGNTNMYISDNMGNRMEHIEVGGEFAIDSELLLGESKKGWFLFPSADPDATSFIFYDDLWELKTKPIPRLWP